LASGGDKITARRNYDRVDTVFNIDTTFMIMGNDELLVNSPDIMEHCIQFNSVNQFKTQAEIDRMREEGESELFLSSYKIKSPTIKDSVKSEEWKKAAAYLIFENYINVAVVVEAEADEDDNTGNVRKNILQKFEITKNMDDYMLCDVVYNTVADCHKKVNNELQSLGVIKKKSSKAGETRLKMCFWGLKLRAAIVEESEEEVEP
jgi:hypothetical protein